MLHWPCIECVCQTTRVMSPCTIHSVKIWTSIKVRSLRTPAPPTPTFPARVISSYPTCKATRQACARPTDRLTGSYSHFGCRAALSAICGGGVGGAKRKIILRGAFFFVSRTGMERQRPTFFYPLDGYSLSSILVDTIY